MAEHTNQEIQQALRNLGLYSGLIDGALGTISSEALVKFQKSKGLAENGIPDDATLKALFPGQAGPRSIKVAAIDWLLNFLKSKTVYAAGAVVAAVAVWANTKLGLSIPDDLQNTITQLLVYGGMALIGVLQMWFNSPHVSTKQPAVVLKPSEMK